MNELQMTIISWAAVIAGLCAVMWLLALMALQVYESVKDIKSRCELSLSKWSLELEVNKLTMDVLFCQQRLDEIANKTKKKA